MRVLLFVTTAWDVLGRNIEITNKAVRRTMYDERVMSLLLLPLRHCFLGKCSSDMLQDGVCVAFREGVKVFSVVCAASNN